MALSRRDLLQGAVLGAASAGLKPMADRRQPTIYLPHGGGPCFFMEWTMGPPDTWDRMAAWLGKLVTDLPERPQALLVISAHWEQPLPTVTTSAKPSLLYDYTGFPPHTYELTWPAAGHPALAAEIEQRLKVAGIKTASDEERGLDHGVFIPLKLSVPQADIPTVQLSLQQGLDPAGHLAIGRALAPLRERGVLILGSGMSYHNMRGFNRSGSHPASKRFDAWLSETVALPPAERDQRLTRWASAPDARACHPREEHLLPLMVVAGAAGDDRGRTLFTDRVMDVVVSGHAFG